MRKRPYGWYGGKYRIVNKIKFLIPEHSVYNEPFMGAASVGLNHARSKIEIFNDKDSEVACFMRTLADREQGKILVEKLCNLTFGKEVFDNALENEKRNFKGLDDIEKSVMVYILITQSFDCKRKNFSEKLYKYARAYQKRIRKNIPRVYERLRDVRVLNMDGIDLLSEIKDDVDTFAFVDPPYRLELRAKNAGKAYKCELSHEDQVKLLETIRHAKCKIMLCGYKSENGEDLYDRYLLPYGWKCYKLAELTKTCQIKEKKDKGKEYIWVNYELPEQAKYAISMKTHSTL